MFNKDIFNKIFKKTEEQTKDESVSFNDENLYKTAGYPEMGTTTTQRVFMGTNKIQQIYKGTTSIHNFR